MISVLLRRGCRVNWARRVRYSTSFESSTKENGAEVVPSPCNSPSEQEFDNFDKLYYKGQIMKELKKERG